MRALAIAAALALAAPGAQAQGLGALLRREAPAAVTSWDQDQPHLTMTRERLCYGHTDTAPGPGDSRALELTSCWGEAESQWTDLREGVLTLNRGARVEPEEIPEHPGQCKERVFSSFLRRTVTRVCRAERDGAATNVRREMVDPETALIVITYSGPGAEIAPGHPLRVSAMTEAPGGWSYDLKTKSLRFQGLCASINPEDASPGAPVLLEACGADAAARKTQWVIQRAAALEPGQTWRPSRALERKKKALLAGPAE